MSFYYRYYYPHRIIIVTIIIITVVMITIMIINSYHEKLYLRLSLILYLIGCQLPSSPSKHTLCIPLHIVILSVKKTKKRSLAIVVA